MAVTMSPRRAVHGPFRWLGNALSAGLDAANATPTNAARFAFAATMITLGVLGLVHGDFALVWQHMPIEPMPGRVVIAYACAAVELLCGLGLLLKATLAIAARVLAVFLLAWLVLLKLPAVVAVPSMEATWLGFGEIAVMFVGGWILFATHAGTWAQSHLEYAVGARGIAVARALFALSLPMIGLSHLVYGEQTASYVPHWIPYPLMWAYLTGVASIAASLGLLFGFWPRLAATLEAAMLGVITLLVWGPGLTKLPPDRTTWTAFAISSAIACGAWIVADTYRGLGWTARPALRPSAGSDPAAATPRA